MTNNSKVKYLSEAEQAYNRLNGIEKMLLDSIITQQYALLTLIAKTRKSESNKIQEQTAKYRYEEYEFPNDL